MISSVELAHRLDPVLMAEAAGYILDDWQQTLCRSKHPRILLNIHRQGGKSLVCAIVALHTAMYEPGSPVLMVSPSLRQSSELFRTALSIYRALDKPVAPEIENRLSLELENNSRLISLPGSESTIRGLSGVRLIVADEASRIPDTLLAAIRPFLAISNGRLIAPSTPAGRRGWWYEAWEHGGDTWERYQVKASECQRISRAFLDDERRALGPNVYAREYECSFDDDELSVFSEELIQRCITKEQSSWAAKIPPPAWAQSSLSLV